MSVWVLVRNAQIRARTEEIVIVWKSSRESSGVSEADTVAGCDAEDVIMTLCVAPRLAFAAFSVRI